MIDVLMTVGVLVFLVVVTGLRASRHPASLRRWFWVALAEYMLCALWQFYNGADANGYRQAGMELLTFLDASFGWAGGEMLSLLLQRPSAFDSAAIGPGTNTGSMCAAAAWVLFFVRGSAYAAQALVAGLAMLGSFAIYEAFQDARPDVSPFRLFAATVLFPSIAFWTSALHKEAFCLMGMGLVLAAWRAAYNRRFRAVVYAPLGLVLVVVFRPPALPPLLLGLVVYFMVERIRKTRGGDAPLARPLYFVLGLGALALGMVVVSRVSPDLALDRIGDTVAVQQKAWSMLAANGGGGGSGFGLDEPVVQSTAAQIASAPLALVNALFRPQLFDVTNVLVLVSALEMTVITWLLYRAIRQHGLKGIVANIQQSPFLLMCTVITVVGCTFVGLTTRNFGTLARYRVPFLPFYGALLATLTERAAGVVAKRSTPPAQQRRAPRRRRTPAVAAPTT